MPSLPEPGLSAKFVEGGNKIKVSRRAGVSQNQAPSEHNQGITGKGNQKGKPGAGGEGKKGKGDGDQANRGRGTEFLLFPAHLHWKGAEQGQSWAPSAAQSLQ